MRREIAGDSSQTAAGYEPDHDLQPSGHAGHRPTGGERVGQGDKTGDHGGHYAGHLHLRLDRRGHHFTTAALIAAMSARNSATSSSIWFTFRSVWLVQFPASNTRSSIVVWLSSPGMRDGNMVVRARAAL